MKIPSVPTWRSKPHRYLAHRGGRWSQEPSGSCRPHDGVEHLCVHLAGYVGPMEDARMVAERERGGREEEGREEGNGTGGEREGRNEERERGGGKEGEESEKGRR